MTVKYICLTETRSHWAEHSSFELRIEGSVLSHTVGKEMNHQLMTCRETGGGDAVGAV